MACFRAHAQQGLTPLDTMARPLGLNQTTPPAGPPGTASEIFFNPEGSALLVTVKGSPAAGAAHGYLAVYPVRFTTYSVVCGLLGGLWSMVYGLRSVVCGLLGGLWSMVCGLWSVVCCLWSTRWSMVCGLWSMVCGLWSVVYGLWSMVTVEMCARRRG